MRYAASQSRSCMAPAAGRSAFQRGVPAGAFQLVAACMEMGLGKEQHLHIGHVFNRLDIPANADAKLVVKGKLEGSST